MTDIRWFHPLERWVRILEACSLPEEVLDMMRLALFLGGNIVNPGRLWLDGNCVRRH